MKPFYKEYCLNSISTEHVKLVRYTERALWGISIDITPYIIGEILATPFLTDRVDFRINGDKYIQRHTIASWSGRVSLPSL
jgi:hypothetical protein